MKRTLCLKKLNAPAVKHAGAVCMKITLLVVALNMIIFSPLLANRAIAQNSSEVKVSLELKNEPLKRAFEQIEKQTEFRFAYNRRMVDTYNITISIQDIAVEQVMEILLKNTALSFRQVNNKIIIFNREDKTAALPVTIIKADALTADGSIKGKISDDKGEPVAGATIMIGAGRSLSASATGEFTITGLRPGVYQLKISAVGFTAFTQAVTIADGSIVEVSVSLTAANNSLNEVIVTGYSKQSKRDVTGAVSTISADVINKTPVTDVNSILQGRVAGVTVDGQGGPGNEQKVRIRGVGTIGDNDPLYVIDGVQIKEGFRLINPGDIESITILKDAASCALYGARGSNGVIVLTTKRGKTGAPRLEYNSYIGSEMPNKFPALLSPQQYADAYWGYLKNSGLSFNSSIYGNGAAPVIPDYLIGKKLAPTFLAVMEGDPAANASLYNLSTYRILKANKSGTDWFGAVFDPALTQSHQLAISGATDKSNYAVTLNYLDNNGILRNTYFNRYSLRVNTEFKVTPWLRVGENFQFAYTQGSTVNDHTDQNLIANLYNTSPLLPTHDIGGNLAGTNGMPTELGDNPYVGRVKDKGAFGYTARMLGSSFVEIEPLKGLVLQTKATIDYLPYQNRFSQDTAPQFRFPVTSFKFSEFAGYSLEWRVTHKLSYSATINGIHKIAAFVAYESSESIFRGVGASSDSVFYNLPGFQVASNNTGVHWQLSGNQDRNTYVSQIANVNYSLADKYLATVTVRRDGSSKFIKSQRFGVFPSASVGWRMSGEKFMNNLEWLNDLKLRASYGTSGNDNIQGGLIYNQYYTDPQYTYYDLAGSNNSAQLGFGLSQIGNILLQWEENHTTNLGFDASLFQNRLSLGFSWFNRVTNKLLFNPAVTALQGDAGAPFQNIMNFTNKGIEIEAGFYGPKNTAVTFDMNGNVSTYRNKVTYIDGRPESFILGGLYARATNLTRSIVGQPVSSFYGYVYDGIILEGDDKGHFRFKDISGPDGKPDNVVNDMDRTYIGSPHPKLSYGYNLNLFYKHFDFSLFVQGVYGNKIFN
ncbi:MAG: SusC/RagA family TonB-linked outer membrane protein, partial [Flavitalea sp.]